VWRTKGLPQHGFPNAVATTWVRAESDVKVRVVRADPRMMRPAAGGLEAPVVLAVASGGRGPLSLWWSGGTFAVAPDAPTPDAMQLAGGFPPGTQQTAVARIAAGVQDADGMLVWVELFPEARADARTAAAMDALLHRLGCSVRIALAGSARAFLGGSLDGSGETAVPAPPGAARLVRIPGPHGYPIFTETPLVPIQVWRPLQAKRVRYFYKPAPAASGSAAGVGAGVGAGMAGSPPASTASPSQASSAATNTERSSIRVQSRP
jgi:hypothetical protein